MLSSFDDIEERIKDLKDFESAVADSDVMENIWDGMESRLQTENSVFNLKNLEYTAPADVWTGIEKNLLGDSIMKPIWWWMSGVAASLLLLMFGGSQILSVKDNSSIANNQNVDKTVFKPLIEGFSSFENNNTTINKSNSELIQIPESSELLPNKNDLKNKQNSENKEVFLVEKGEKRIGVSGLIAINTTKELVGRKNKKINTTNTESNNVKEAKFNSTPLLAVADLEIENVNNSTNSSNSIDVKTSDLNLSDNNNSLASPLINDKTLISEFQNDNKEKYTDSDQKTSLLSNVNERENVLVSIPTVVIKKEDSLNITELLEDDLITSSLDESIEETDNNKYRKFKLYFSTGVGNIKPIAKTFEIVPVEENASIVVSVPKQRPGGGNAVIPEPIDEEDEKLLEANAGLNYIKFSIPISFSLEGEYNLTKNIAVRTGVTHTKLSYYYEKSEVGNKIDLKYLSIPLTGVVTIIDGGKFKFNGVGGSRVERMISSKYVMLDGREVFNDESFNDVESKGQNVALLVGFDLEYKLNNNSSIGIYPKASKYVSLDTQDVYNRDLEVVWPEINLGYSVVF